MTHDHTVARPDFLWKVENRAWSTTYPRGSGWVRRTLLRMKEVFVMNEAQMIVEAFRRLETGQRAALATVVSVEGSSYRRPGARMLITESGETTGVLSDGC